MTWAVAVQFGYWPGQSAPAGGTISEINAELMDSPELVNQDCYGDAWMIVIELDDLSEIDSLMDARAYAEYLAQEVK